MIDALLKLAHQNPGVGRGKLAACIVKKGTVLGWGFNQKKSHPLQAKFTHQPHNVWLHAETDALRNSLRNHTLEEIAGATLYIARAKKNGTPGIACPCQGCQNALAYFGISKAIYTLSSDDPNQKPIGSLTLAE